MGESAMSEGDHIRVKRGLYYHHGIDIGDKTVVHFCVDNKTKADDACIKRTAIQDFLIDNTSYEIINYQQCNDPDKVIEIALSFIGSKNYSLFNNNCEHFARYCKTGDKKSEQIKDVKELAFLTLSGSTFTYAGITSVSILGVVSGLSASGVMSGLAAIGGIAGGGVAAGIGLASAPAAITANLAMNKMLEDDQKLSDEERKARKIGRYASVGGTFVGATTTVATISAAGSVAGLSAAGITSGLSAIGGTLGGGMLAGAAISIAAPAVFTATIGYGAYKGWKWIFGK